MTGRARKVVLIGAGGLGCAAAPVLARGGGHLTVEVVDDDRVDLSNLHRQVLHPSGDVGQPKARSLATAIAALGGAGGPTAIAREARVGVDNAAAIVGGADLVLDGSDNFATRFLVNDACALLGVPLVHAAAIRWQGQLLAVDTRAGAPCYRCLFEAPPAPGAGMSCAEAGVAGPVVGVVGALAAEAALAILAGAAPPVARAADGAPLGTLLVYDGLRAAFRVVRFRKNPGCLACGEAPLAQLLPRTAYEVPAC